MEHFKKNCLKRKDKGEKEKTFNDVNIASEGKIFDDVEIVLVVFVSSLGDGWILYSTYTYLLIKACLTLISLSMVLFC